MIRPGGIIVWGDYGADWNEIPRLPCTSRGMQEPGTVDFPRPYLKKMPGAN